MRRWCFGAARGPPAPVLGVLLVVLSVGLLPAAQAVEPELPAVSGELRVEGRVAVDAAISEIGDPTPGLLVGPTERVPCQGGSFDHPPFGARFSEARDEVGCGRWWFDIRVPNGTASVELHFLLSRFAWSEEPRPELERGFEQRLVISRTGERAFEAPDRVVMDVPLADPLDLFREAVPVMHSFEPGAGGPLRIEWSFRDLGGARSTPVGDGHYPSAVGYRGTVENVTIVLDGVPIEVDVLRQPQRQVVGRDAHYVGELRLRAPSGIRDIGLEIGSYQGHATLQLDEGASWHWTGERQPTPQVATDATRWTGAWPMAADGSTAPMLLEVLIVEPLHPHPLGVTIAVTAFGLPVLFGAALLEGLRRMPAAQGGASSSRGTLLARFALVVALAGWCTAILMAWTRMGLGVLTTWTPGAEALTLWILGATAGAALAVGWWTVQRMTLRRLGWQGADPSPT